MMPEAASAPWLESMGPPPSPTEAAASSVASTLAAMAAASAAVACVVCVCVCVSVCVSMFVCAVRLHIDMRNKAGASHIAFCCILLQYPPYVIHSLTALQFIQ